jgi:phosphoenolpyruvate phosphomutase
MKALILNSGSGTRMGSLTDGRPKCLLEISKGTTILGRQLGLLRSCGIRELVITTGPRASLIQEHVKASFPGIDVAYVHNPDYATTNYIYSMHLARTLIEDDLLLLHGDIVTEKSVCDRLVETDAANGVIVSKPSMLPEKDFKARIENGLVLEISVSLKAPDSVFLLPFYKLSKHAMSLWLSEIAFFVEKGITGVYAEEAFNRISGELDLAPVYIKESELCMEVDDAGDLERVRRLLAERK